MTEQHPTTYPTSYTAAVTLTPGEPTASLMRLVSVLHRRGTVVEDLTFRAEDGMAMQVTARVSLRNTEWHNLQESLRRLVDVVDVSVRPHARPDSRMQVPERGSPLGSRLGVARTG